MDEGHNETDALLRLLEERISSEYEKASREAQAKFDKYLRKFEADDKARQQDVIDGKMSQDDYVLWRQGRILTGKRWQDMSDSLAADYSNVNQIAMKLVNDQIPDVYALNHNYAAYQLEHDTLVDLSFTLYDRSTVELLLKDAPDLLPKAQVDIPLDIRWNKQKINSAVTQGILQGEKIGDISEHLQQVTDMNHTAAMRNARTMATAAENAGRIDSYTHAQQSGVKMRQQWIATLDDRTRHTHALLDGEQVETGGTFSNGCRYPGDPLGKPSEVYNCRCTLVAVIEGVDTSDAKRNNKLGKLTYEGWKESARTRVDKSKQRKSKGTGGGAT